MSEQELQKLADTIADRAKICSKNVLTTEEVASYTGLSVSYIYKLTAAKKIPHYKPTGKACYFNREEVEEWLQSNRVSTAIELDAQAAAYCNKTKKGGAKL